MLIGEVAERSGISTRMLRHYESLGLVSASTRTSNGYRSYSSDDIRRLFQIEALRSLGLGLREIADIIDNLTFDAQATLDGLLQRTEDSIAQQQALRDHLLSIKDSEPADWSDVLGTIDLMHGLNTTNPSERLRLALSLQAPEHSRNVTVLIDAALQETDTNAAGALDWTLVQIGDEAIPPVQQALQAPSAQRRHRAVTILSKLGSAAANTALADAYPHADPFVHRRAALAHARRGGHSAIPTLVDLIVDGDDDVEAAEVLAELCAAFGLTDEVIAAIGNALTLVDPAARQRLAAALAEIAGESAMHVLCGMTNDPDRGVALTAKHLLQQHS